MQGGDCNLSDRRPASARPPQRVFTGTRKEDAKGSARRAREIRQTARRNAGTSADENATILYHKLWNGWPQPPSAATLSFEERIGVVRCYLGSWDHVFKLSKGRKEELVANLPDELYTASFETIRTFFRRGEALGMSDPHEVAAHIIATFMSQKALADVHSWPHDLDESLGRRQEARDLTRGPPASIGGELPVAFSVKICTGRGMYTDICVGTGGAACPRASRPTCAVVATEGATGAALGVRIRTIRATWKLCRTYCAKCGDTEARARGSFMCVRVDGHFCEGPSAGSPCPSNGGLGYMASFDLADASGSGDGDDICDAFFAARRGGRVRFCAGCAAKRATGKQFVTQMSGALRLSDDQVALIIRSAWKVAGPPLADWGKGIGLWKNDWLGQRVLDKEVAKFQERAAVLAAAPAPAPAAAPPAVTPATARAQPVDVSAPAPAPDFLPWRPSARKKRARSPSPSQPAYGAMPRPSLGSWLRRRRPRSWIG